MSEANEPAIPRNTPEVDPAFYTNINEFLELAHRQTGTHGAKATSLVALYGAARFNALVYLEAAKGEAGAQRTAFLDYMTDLYRRVLNEHLDNLGAQHGIDVGESELAEEYKASGYVPGKGFPGDEGA